MKSNTSAGTVNTNTPSTPQGFSRAIRQKVFRAAVAELLDAPALQSASPLVAGCAWAVLRLVCDQPDLEIRGSHLKVDMAVGELVGKGVDRSTALDVVDFLVRKSVFIGQGADISIPALDAELSTQLRIFSNRSQGWQKRSEGKGAALAPQKPAREAQPANHPPAKPVTASDVKHEVDLLGQSPAAASAGAASPKETKRQLTGPAPETGEDTVIARMLTKDGLEFEVFKSYADGLIGTYRHINVLDQLNLARAWCLSNESQRKTAKGMPKFINGWLSRANQAAELRAAVVSSTKQGNGFGQGATSQLVSTLQPDASPQSGVAGDALDIGSPRAAGQNPDDFSDLHFSFESPGGGDLILGDGEASFDAPGASLDDEPGAPTTGMRTPAENAQHATQPVARRIPQAIANARQKLAGATQFARH